MEVVMMSEFGRLESRLPTRQGDRPDEISGPQQLQRSVHGRDAQSRDPFLASSKNLLDGQRPGGFPDHLQNRVALTGTSLTDSGLRHLIVGRSTHVGSL